MPIKTFFLLILILSLPCLCISQNILIEGKLIDTKGSPIPFVNIVLKNSPQIGTMSDINGLYELKVATSALQKSEQFTLIFSSLGYKKREVSVEKKSLIKLDVTLKEDSESLDIIVLESNSDASREYTVLEITKMDIYTNPTANADPLLAIQLNPFSTNTDETANPSFRGSNPDKSRVLLNEVPVLNPVRNSQVNGLGSFSLFNTEIINKQLVYPSNPPLIYGNSSAGIVEIETNNEISKSTQISLSLANVGVFMNRKLSDESFIQLYSNKQFSDFFLGINQKGVEFLKDFSSIDGGLNLRLTTDDTSYINVFSYAINEKFEAESQILNESLNNIAERTRVFTIANYVKRIGKSRISFNTGFDHSKGPLSLGNINATSRENNFYSSFNYSRKINDFFIKSGVSYNFIDRSFKGFFPVFPFAFSPDSPSIFSESNSYNQILETYVYGKVKLDDVIISSAIRKNIPVTNKIETIKSKDDYLSFQASLKWNLNKKNSFIFSSGKYHNYGNPTLINATVPLNSSVQVSLDYSYENKNTKLMASLYSKKEKGFVNNSLNLIDNSINSRSFKGIEFQYKRDLSKALSFNLSYTFLDSKIRFNDRDSRGANDLDYFIKGLIMYKKNGWTISLASTIRPGTYYSEVVSSTFIDEANTFAPIFSDNLNSQQLDNYTKLDFSLNKTLQIGSHRQVIFFSINNLLNTENERNILFNNDYSATISRNFAKRIIYFGTVFYF